MDEFPEFMRNPANRIAAEDQATAGAEGYVFDGVDGSQMAFWTCRESVTSTEHVHEYDEYVTVVQGWYTLIIDGNEIPVKAGNEYFIQRGTPHAGRAVKGIRTIHAFGGQRVHRSGT